jgi:flavin-dependent dehydrogenase
VERADVLIVGGGPAGSACAARLVAAGRDVLVVDAREFPRDKPCAGWITPEVVAETALDLREYGRDHTLQPISCFRVGRIGGRAVDVEYEQPVSYGIRRCEFDAFLLRRSGARVRTERVSEVQRDGGSMAVSPLPCSWGRGATSARWPGRSPVRPTRGG